MFVVISRLFDWSSIETYAVYKQKRNAIKRTLLGYPPLPNYHYPNFRDNFPGFQQQPHYHHCGPQQTHSYAPAWPLNKQQFSNQIPQQSVKVESSSTPPKASNKMELARLMHHDIKPDPIHLGMSILNLPNNQTNQLQSTPSVPPPLLNQLTTNSTMDSK
jgi:hypothetical protein